MGIKHTSLQQLKAAPLSKVVEATGGSLKKIGREFVTQCVWHDDTNPSLTINDDKGFCFCHVCRGGGDSVDYLKKRKGLDFFDAANLAGEILGIRIETDDENPEEAAKRREARRRAIADNESSNKRYQVNLHDARASRIRQILKDRGLTKEAAVEFELGFAPSGPFAGRITIPIYDHRNDLVGWTGRATKDQPGKYKNSADGPLFNKKSLVFNEFRGKEAAREAGCLIFVEGHLDVVSMWQAGIRNVVAMQGTAAPDPTVLQRLARTVKNFILCYDGDAGGSKAVEQFISVAGPMAMKGEVSITVVNLPDGKDPDEVIKSGENLYDMIANAEPWLDWVIDSWVSELDLQNGAEVTEVEDRLKALINGLKSKALRTHYIDKAAQALSSSEKEAVQLAKDWGSSALHVGEHEWTIRTPQQTQIAAERRLLRIYVHRPDHREFLSPLLDKIQHPPLKWLATRLRELEEVSLVDLTPHSVMAVVGAAEPHFLQQLRTIVRPNVIIDEAPGVLSHLSDILNRSMQIPPHEPDTNQPSA